VKVFLKWSRKNVAHADRKLHVNNPYASKPW